MLVSALVERLGVRFSARSFGRRGTLPGEPWTGRGSLRYLLDTVDTFFAQMTPQEALTRAVCTTEPYFPSPN